MVNVSQKWKDNQNSSIHAQGYVKISLTDENDTVTLSSLDAGSRIKQTVHKRSFDPTGIEGPKNDLKVELYNYDGTYTHYYSDYAGQPMKIEVKYGYVFDTGTEEIQGGVFEVDTISLGDDDTITFDAVSKLEKSDAEVTFVNTATGKPVILWEAQPGERPTTADISADVWIDELWSVSMNDIISDIDSAADFDIVSSVSVSGSVSSVGSGGAVTIAAAEAIQQTVNAANIKCVVDRNGNVSLSGYKVFNSNVSMRNMFDRPAFQRSKQLKGIQGVSGEAIQLTDSDMGGGYAERSVRFEFDEAEREYFGLFTLDKPLRWAQLARLGSTQSLKKITCTLDSDGGYQYEIRTGTAGADKTVRYQTYEINSTTITVDISNIPYGEVCDISNSISLPSDADAIINYFSNRSIYSAPLRGDPARDVGDIVFLETSKGVFEKALILESELTFDGVFAEDIKARIIDTDFANFETDETALKYFTIVNGVLTAFNYTQAQADGVTEITVPMNVKEIADRVFYGCAALTKVNFYPTLETIGDSAFSSCSGLTEMILPDSVTSIGEGMLAMADENNAMRTLILSNSLTEIPDFFAECLALDELYLPDSITKVGGAAFGNSFTTTKIRLSSNLTEIGQNSFASTKITSIVIPGGIKNIPYGAFMHCDNLKDIFICPGVETIGMYAFLGSDNPKTVIPPTVTNIHEDAFSAPTDPNSPVIWGYKGTAAETFARERGFEFVDIDKNE